MIKVNEKNQKNLKTLIEKLKSAEEESEKIHERLSEQTISHLGCFGY